MVFGYLSEERCVVVCPTWQCVAICSILCTVFICPQCIVGPSVYYYYFIHLDAQNYKMFICAYN